MANLSDEDLVQAYKEACTRGLATDFIVVLEEELIGRRISLLNKS
ncbi:sporulation histidine kinase inhibitor Sda [Alkalicoccobacillus gibsonii]|uniref:Sporulation histidine kinase inhibitor Sda n=1 Tax=Alkalicoccobacillus gibsonii TaxID=79881 RepID=A0ABU9VD52_9BACI